MGVGVKVSQREGQGFRDRAETQSRTHTRKRQEAQLDKESNIAFFSRRGKSHKTEQMEFTGKHSLLSYIQYIYRNMGAHRGRLRKRYLSCEWVERGGTLATRGKTFRNSRRN